MTSQAFQNVQDKHVLIPSSSMCRHATQMILNQLPHGYQSFVKESPQSQSEDMVPEPDFKHNTLMKAAYQSVDISPSEDDPCASS